MSDDFSIECLEFARTHPSDLSAIGIITLVEWIDKLTAEIARRDEIIARLKENSERLTELPYPPLSGMSSQDNFDRGTACKYCHKVRSVGHAPDCPITIHRALMKELEER